MKLDRQTANDRLSKLEHEVGSLKHILSVGNTFQGYSPIPAVITPNLVNEQLKRNLNYGVINSSDNYDESFHVNKFVSQSPPRRQGDNEEGCFDGSHVMQLEKDALKLRRELQDAIASKKNADSRIIA